MQEAKEQEKRKEKRSLLIYSLSLKIGMCTRSHFNAI